MAAELDNVAPDTSWLLPMSRSVGDNLGELPELGLADAGYGKRNWSAEPPNGWIKNVRGLRQFSMRGLHPVQADRRLVCMALNLRRMATMEV